MARAPIGSVSLPSIILRRYSARECLNARPRGRAWANPVSTHFQPTYVCGLAEPGTTRIRKNRVKCGRAQTEFNPG